MRTIDTLVTGGTVLPCRCAKPVADNTSPSLQPMTARERQIAYLVAEGLSNKSIAAKLGIVEGTVKVHLHNVYLKLGVSSRVRLAAAIESHD